MKRMTALILAAVLFGTSGCAVLAGGLAGGAAGYTAGASSKDTEKDED